MLIQQRIRFLALILFYIFSCISKITKSIYFYTFDTFIMFWVLWLLVLHKTFDFDKLQTTNLNLYSYSS